MHRKLNIQWRDGLSSEMLQLATRRTDEFVAFYGKNITTMNISTVAASCYLQGIEDCLAVVDKCPASRPVLPARVHSPQVVY